MTILRIWHLWSSVQHNHFSVPFFFVLKHRQLQKHSFLKKIEQRISRTSKTKQRKNLRCSLPQKLCTDVFNLVYKIERERLFVVIHWYTRYTLCFTSLCRLVVKSVSLSLSQTSKLGHEPQSRHSMKGFHFSAFEVTKTEISKRKIKLAPVCL